jgi:hypothetical protein
VNSLRRVLPGSGRLAEELRAALTAEGLVLLEENLTGSITYRNYRAPGQRSSLKKEAISGAIAVTASRLVVWTGRSKHIDVPLNHPLRAAIEVSYDPPDRVRFAYDAAAFGPSRSGQVEVRLRTPQAAHIADLLAAARE